jgi:molybdopterin-guanine dinucleotide biosynthesis protein
VDIVLVEGFKQSPGTRIEVVRRARSTELTTDSATLFALVTDEPTLASVCARVFGLEDTEGLADAIETLVSKRDGGDDDGRA